MECSASPTYRDDIRLPIKESTPDTIPSDSEATFSQVVRVQLRVEYRALGLGEEARLVRARGEEEEDHHRKDEGWKTLDQEEDAPCGQRGFDVRNAKSNNWCKGVLSQRVESRLEGLGVRPPNAPASVPAPMKSARRLESSSFLYQRE